MKQILPTLDTCEMVRSACLVAVLLLLLGCKPVVQSSSYGDCILENSSKATNSEVLSTIKAACRAKFPIEFDFTALSQKAGVKAWAGVVTSPTFTALTSEERIRAREQYFNEVVAPQVLADYTEEARAQFLLFAQRVERSESTAMENAVPKISSTNGSTSKPRSFPGVQVDMLLLTSVAEQLPAILLIFPLTWMLIRPTKAKWALPHSWLLAGFVLAAMSAGITRYFAPYVIGAEALKPTGYLEVALVLGVPLLFAVLVSLFLRTQVRPVPPTAQR